MAGRVMPAHHSIPHHRLGRPARVIYDRLMRRGGVLFAILGACGFHSPPESGPIDAAAAFCDPADPHLVACYEFEGSANDGSSHGLGGMTSYRLIWV